MTGKPNGPYHWAAIEHHELKRPPRADLEPDPLEGGFADG